MAAYRCPECGYVYNGDLGDEFEGYPACTPFAELPEDFTCPDCAVRVKAEFERFDPTRAGPD